MPLMWQLLKSKNNSMWYRTQFASEKSQSSDHGYEAKIAYSVTENVVRKFFRTKGHYNPSIHEVNQKVNLIIRKIKEKYRNINNMRLHSKDGRITSVIEDIASDILK